MIEALSTSDWHLEGMGKHFTDATKRQLAEIDRIYQYAVQKGIRHVFVPGDLSETPHMTDATYFQLIMFFKKYDGLVETHYIGGNHDRSDKSTTSCDLLHLLATHGFFKTLNVHLQPKQDRIDGTLVNFCAWPCGGTLSEKEGALNFAHITVAGAMGDNGRPLKTSHDFAVHERDYTISGHIHQYQHMKSKKVIYNGNPFQKNFGECLPKGFIHFRATTDKRKVKVQHRFINNNPQFQLENVVIESPTDFQKLRNDDSKRYKLTVAPDVLLPADLRLQYPNITGGIFTMVEGKVKAHENEANLDIPDAVALPRISPDVGLKEFLSGEGHSKKEIRRATDILAEAMNFVGIS